MYGTRAISVFALARVVAGATTAAVVTGPNPEAPPETAQYAFLIGEWNCTIRSMQSDRTFEERQATWTGSYILDGWAIQDHWVDLGPGGGEGINIRSYNTQTGKWDNRWLATGSLQWKYFSSERVGDTMVMTGGEGTDPFGDYIDRNTFYEIGADSWRWRKDRSYDGGETWIEGVAFIEARRAGS